MLLYNLRIAWKSLRRNPILSVLILLGIALGVAVSTTFVTVWHVLAEDPIPGKSDRLFYVRLDSWAPTESYSDTRPGPPSLLTWRDAQALLRSDIPTRQTAMFATSLYVYPQGAQQRPFREDIRMTRGDFFPMFDAPFQFGSGWSRAADARPEAVAVIGADLNDKLFGGRDSVGEKIRLGDREFQIVGVLQPWHTKVRFYDLTGSPNEQPEQIFLPLGWAEPMNLPVYGTLVTWRMSEPGESLQYGASSEGIWLQMWAELENDAQRREYQAFLDAYAGEQKKAGRFQRPLDNRLTPVVDLMQEWEIVPPQARALAAISLLFLSVTALNLIGLFLGKFLARAPIVGIRRALGASRRAIFLQHLVECELIGLLGGLLGLLLSFGTLALVNRLYEPLVRTEGFFELDVPMVATAIGLSLLAGAIAGLYPAWRICSIPPARHLRNQ